MPLGISHFILYLVILQLIPNRTDSEVVMTYYRELKD